jgi:hypothetical protein
MLACLAPQNGLLNEEKSKHAWWFGSAKSLLNEEKSKHACRFGSAKSLLNEEKSKHACWFGSAKWFWPTTILHSLLRLVKGTHSTA